MKMKDKIVIDFKEFFKTGKFDFLKLGKTKEWIIHNFPDPDGFNENPSIYRDPIWRYGNIELHFNKDVLFLIFSDYIDDLDGGDSLELKKWFIGNLNKLNLSDVISELNKAHIDFHKKKSHIVESAVNIELQSSVVLGFHLEENEDEDYDNFLERCKITNQDEFRLSSFSLMQK
ncbi:hypothetical protein [Aquimarina litoralis]|uniref:hypothetical protein n=1 Tax=Aquimarina litoralis TaxID=584605 RepID=UPI001C57CFDC|nr:hypothetical protein [Aquimarina litoralis]MBW1295135.1 hypothetical protein [Aquimarina litoralis]